MNPQAERLQEWAKQMPVTLLVRELFKLAPDQGYYFDAPERQALIREAAIRLERAAPPPPERKCAKRTEGEKCVSGRMWRYSRRNCLYCGEQMPE